MTINRYVGYDNASGNARGTKQLFGPSLPAGITVTLARVTSKLVFVQTTPNSSGSVEGGAWGQAIQVGLNGVVPTNWESSQQDTSIFAYDSSDPDATARVFWAPSSDTAYLQPSLARTLEWRGQYHTTTVTQFYYVVADITNTLDPFYANFAWQLWWAS